MGFLAEFLLLLVPLVGAVIAVIRAISAARERAGERPVTPSPHDITIAEPRGHTLGNQAAQWRTITRVLEEHNRTDTRWLSYELDAAKLLDFPLITDMRDPLTMGFHRAKLRAELLRPSTAEDLLDNPDAAREYLDAVERYVTSFNAAETEAIRRRRNDFSREEQQRLSRAQNLLAHSVRHCRDAAGTRARLRGGAQGARRSDRVAGQYPGRDRARRRRRDRRIKARSHQRPVRPDDAGESGNAAAAARVARSQ